MCNARERSGIVDRSMTLIIFGEGTNLNLRRSSAIYVSTVKIHSTTYIVRDEII